MPLEYNWIYPAVATLLVRWGANGKTDRSKKYHGGFECLPRFEAPYQIDEGEPSSTALLGEINQIARRIAERQRRVKTVLYVWFGIATGFLFGVVFFSHGAV